MYITIYLSVCIKILPRFVLSWLIFFLGIWKNLLTVICFLHTRTPE